MIDKPDFTEADVVAIREAATALAEIAKATNLPKDISAELAQLNSIADRLEVLITPVGGDKS
ncbi:MAG TPA: hypothetical protein VFX40_06255 [Gemmatimonadaceae bacterium]|nr:hypothetical protein [Gemmatimonadaceae bacterium]